ncbi:Protein CBG18647 [Caenorhabditis briggsae]|uniref:Protein CBG18647 n=1 Tax=Caenorhabditis briggsae TaxID=6238 RepID=A8XTT2_CAEBR|nr:Protein CBG18647 [Caenorhabditis briggsae]CAP36058.1 Protein CBG18647 [Caenorhabditis briggsae]
MAPRKKNLIAAEIPTRLVGCHLIIASLIGLIFNIFMFSKFLEFEKTSFYILCTSKTVSNFLILFVFLTYLGPTNLLYTQIGSYDLSKYINQAVGYGIYLQGPMTQFLITINRFLVIWFSPTHVPKYSNHVTVACLIATWVLSIWTSTLYGLPDDCRVPKKSRNSLSSEDSKNRQKTNIRFFLQSCVQDWICALDILNNLTANLYCLNLCTMLLTFSSNVLVYVFDGIAMYLFNHRTTTKRVKPSREPTKESTQTIRVPAPVN